MILQQNNSYTILLCAAIMALLALQAPAKTTIPANREAIPGVVALALKEPLPAGATLHRSGITSLDHTLSALHIHTLEPVTPTSFTRLQKRGNRTRIDNLYFAYYSGGLSPEAVARKLAQNSAIEFAEAKYNYTLAAIPDDPLLSKQYYLDKIALPEAWEISKGEQGEVLIAIIDNGTEITHPDLAANLWRNPGEIPANGIDDDANGLIDDLHGWNFTKNANDLANPFPASIYHSHGTHTAGLVCAVADNALGIAGTSWNARFLVINAASKTSEKDIDGISIDKGIGYAIAHGADVINLSVGGSYSEATRRLVQYALDEGAAIVAAAGNGSSLADDSFPASYPGVLAVAATDDSDYKAYFSNYGYTIDVTAPGVDIWSTVTGGGYEGNWQGTSMSTPIAAGVVALVMTKHPGWSGLQACEQVRMTSDNIDPKNPFYAGKLGRGRINAWRALTESWPSLRIAETEFFDQDGDSLLEPGDSVELTLTLTNHLLPANGLSLKLSANSEYAVITRGSFDLAALGTSESVVLERAFAFRVADVAPSDHVIDFTLSITGNGFRDTDHFALTVMPSYANIGINNIRTTVTNIGRLGSANPGGEGGGIGFLYKSGPNLLCEAALIAGTGPDNIVNAARGLLDYRGGQLNDADFIGTAEGNIRLDTPGSLTDQESRAIFTDGAALDPLNIRVTQETYASAKDGFADLIFLRYTIENLSAEPLQNFHFGIYCDWDMDSGSFASNIASYDDERRLGYAYDSGTGPDTYVGIRLLTPGGISYRAIMNDHADPFNPSWGTHDGFTDEEKWESISGGLSQTTLGPADIANVIASGPHTINAASAVIIDFALAAADNLEMLQTAADSAQVLWRTLLTTLVTPNPEVPLPESWALEANYPNPFNGETIIGYSLAEEAPVRLEILDLSGRLVRSLIQSTQRAGRHQVRWDGNSEQGNKVASGTYLYRLVSDGQQLIRKLIVLR